MVDRKYMETLPCPFPDFSGGAWGSKVARDKVLEIQSLATNFFDLVQQQSALKKRSKQDSETRTAKTAREHCHEHESLHVSSLTTLQLARLLQSSRRKKLSVSSVLQEFEKPDWMPAPRPPDVEFEVDQKRFGQ